MSLTRSSTWCFAKVALATSIIDGANSKAIISAWVLLVPSYQAKALYPLKQPISRTRTD